MSDDYQRVRPQIHSGIDGPILISGTWESHPDGDHKVVPADAVVIPAEELSTPTERVTQHAQAALALMRLAIAEYLTAHQSVDGAQVQAIARALADDRADDYHGGVPDQMDEARRLYDLGVRVPEVTE